MSPSEADFCLYTSRNGKDLNLVVMIYLDDILIMSKSGSLLKEEK